MHITKKQTYTHANAVVLYAYKIPSRLTQTTTMIKACHTTNQSLDSDSPQPHADL